MEIRLQNVCKAYPFKTALSGISVTFAPGKIHALLGENGAGKSTLAKILCGRIRMTSGELFVDGKNVCFASPKEALQSGIAEVQQRPLLSHSLTARQNILLSRKCFSSRGGKEFNAELLALREKWAPTLDLDAKIKDSGGAQHFYTGLLCALMRGFDCLILDEPSSFLTSGERKSLFLHLTEEAKSGKTVILITHSRTEALSYADTVTVLHKGTLEGFFSSPKLYTPILAEAEKRSGTETANETPIETAKEKPQGDSPERQPCLRITNASCFPPHTPAVTNISLCAHYGEITAVASQDDPSFATFENFVTGMCTSKCSGRIDFFRKNPCGDGETVLSVDAKKYSAGFLRRNAVAIVPSNKTFRASFPDLSIEQMLGAFGGNAEELIQKACVSIRKSELCSSLSGGMLQRLILERELSVNPNLVILCNPMQALDISAQALLCRRAEAIAKKGAAVLVLGSQDFPLTLCSTVYTLQGGKIFLSFSKDGVQ